MDTIEHPPQQYLVAGLGNPGREYRETRHNIGFMALDRLAGKLSIQMTRLQSSALVGSGLHNGQRVTLAKPQTFMNLSGQAIGGLLRFYKIPIENLLVVHDDIDLPLGTLRLRGGGGAAGQKGMASIITVLSSQDFPRLRLGVGRPPGRKSAADYVLENFLTAEQDLVNQVLDQACQAALTFVNEGLNTAMNRFNGSLTKE